MQNTITLLDKALSMESAAFWSKKLGLNRKALSNCKWRGQVSPAIAGALALEIDPEHYKDWVMRAVIESEKDSKAVELLKRALNTA